MRSLKTDNFAVVVVVDVVIVVNVVVVALLVVIDHIKLWSINVHLGLLKTDVEFLWWVVWWWCAK